MNNNISYGVIVAIESDQVQVRVQQELIEILVDAETRAAAESVLNEENAIVAIDLSTNQLLLEVDDSESRLACLEGI